MNHHCVQQIVHVIWSTQNQQFKIPLFVREKLYPYISTKIKSKEGKLDLAGGHDDHIHCLISLPPTISIASMIQFIKNYSSQWIKHQEHIDLRLNFHFCLHLLFLGLLPLFSLGQPNDIPLDQHHGKELTVRGYLHHTEEDLCVLTPEPNTPSCCVAAPHKTAEQVFLDGLFTPTNQPVTIQGLLDVNDSHPQFVLKYPKIIEENKRSFPWISLSLGAILLSCVAMKKKFIDR